MPVDVARYRPVDSREYLRGDGSDETTAFGRLLTAGAGKLVHLYPASSGEYLVSDALAVSTAHTRIVAMPGTVIRQTTKYKPIFDVSADDVAIEGVYGEYTGSTAYTSGGSPFRGDDPYAYGAMIWSNANRGHFRNNRADGFTAGIHLSSWNGSALSSLSKSDNEIDGLKVSGVVWGVLTSGQVRPIIHRIRGTYALPSGGPDPSHLIYVSPGGGSNYQQDIDVAHCSAFDGGDAHPYQFKNVLGGKAVDLLGRNCHGWAAIFNSTGLRVQGVMLDDLGDAENGSLYTVSNNVGNTYDLLYRAKDGTTGFRVARLDGKDCSLTLKGRIRQPTDQSGGMSVTVLGTRNDVTVDLVNIDDDGSDMTTGRLAVYVDAATGARIKVNRARNVYYAVQVPSGATDTTVDLDPTQVSRSSGLSVNAVLAVGDASTQVRQTRRRQAETISGAGTVLRTDPALYDQLHVTVSTADNFTINTPYPGGTAPGMRYLVLVHNNSGGAMGTITWGPTLASAWANPASGARNLIEFVYDGATWREIARSF